MNDYCEVVASQKPYCTADWLSWSHIAMFSTRGLLASTSEMPTLGMTSDVHLRATNPILTVASLVKR